MSLPYQCPKCGADLKGAPAPYPVNFTSLALVIIDEQACVQTHWGCPKCAAQWPADIGRARQEFPNFFDLIERSRK